MSYLSLIADSDPRKAYILPADTEIQADEGIFKITNKPVHCGGNAVLYYAHKEGSDIDFVLKEYFPYNGYLRRNGIIVPYAFLSATSDEQNNLCAVESEIQATVQAEEQQSQLIYRYTSRVAVNRTSLHVSHIVCPDGTTYAEPEGVTDPWHFLLLDDLSQKGVFLTDIIAEATYPHSDGHPLGNYEPRPILGKPLPILDINITIKVISSVLEVLARIHEEAHFIHSDIQPNNIFFEGADLKRGIVGHAMFLDFGSAHRLQANGTTDPLLMTEVTGTPAYAPPELYSEQDISLTPAADIYSVGRLFLALIKPRTAISSYGSTTSPNISYNQLRIKPGEERASHCSPPLAKSINAILKKALEPDPELRYQSAREMLEAIEALTPRYSLPEGLSTPEFFIEHSRDEELKQLEQALENGVKPIWIWGFGGLGKTELVNEFGRRCKQKNCKVAMFHFHDSIQQTILDLNISGYQYVAPNGLSSEEKQHAEFGDRLRVLNGFGSDMVLIMDNFDSEKLSLNDLRQSKDYSDLLKISPSLIITTRFNPGPAYKSNEICPLSENSLLQIFKQCGVDAEEDTLLKLIRVVNGHTLTISLMAKALVENMFDPISPKALLEAFRSYDLKSINDIQIETDKNRAYQYNSILGHLKILFDISGLSNEQKEVLQYLTIVPPDGLDANLFYKVLNSGEQESISRLLARGWLTVDKQTHLLHVHPLIVELISNEISPDISTFAPFITYCSQATFFNGKEENKTAIRKLNFVQAMISSKWFTATADTAKLCCNAGYHWFKRGYRVQGISDWEIGLEFYITLQNECPGIYDYDVASEYGRIGFLLSATSEFTETSEQLLTASLRLWENLRTQKPDMYNEEYADVCDCYGYLLSLGKSTNSYKAKDYLETALDIRRTLYKSNPEKYRHDYAWTEDNLGKVLTHTSFKQAQDLLESALALRREDSNISEIAWTLHNLADLYATNPDYHTRAGNAYQESLSLREELERMNPGSHLADISWLQFKLAHLYLKYDYADELKLSEAERLLHQACSTQKDLEDKTPGMFVTDIPAIEAALYRLALGNIGDKISDVTPKSDSNNQDTTYHPEPISVKANSSTTAYAIQAAQAASDHTAFYLDSQESKKWLLVSCSFGMGYPLTDSMEIGKASSMFSLEPHTEHVSRKHATIHIAGGQIYITDSSTNGTSLNGARISKGVPTLLHEDDKISFADISFILRKA